MRTGSDPAWCRKGGLRVDAAHPMIFLPYPTEKELLEQMRTSYFLHDLEAQFGILEPDTTVTTFF